MAKSFGFESLSPRTLHESVVAMTHLDATNANLSDIANEVNRTIEYPSEYDSRLYDAIAAYRMKIGAEILRHCDIPPSYAIYGTISPDELDARAYEKVHRPEYISRLSGHRLREFENRYGRDEPTIETLSGILIEEQAAVNRINPTHDGMPFNPLLVVNVCDGRKNFDAACMPRSLDERQELLHTARDTFLDALVLCDNDPDNTVRYPITTGISEMFLGRIIHDLALMGEYKDERDQYLYYAIQQLWAAREAFAKNTPSQDITAYQNDTDYFIDVYAKELGIDPNLYPEAQVSRKFVPELFTPQHAAA